MQNSSSPPPKLAYASASIRHPWRVWSRLGRIPCWVLAVLLTVPLQFAERSDLFHQILPYWAASSLIPFLLLLALLIPGALQRINGRHMLLLLLVSLPLYGVLALLQQAWSPVPFVYATLLAILLPLLCVGACECYFAFPRDRVRLLWLLLFLTAAAFVLALIVLWLTFSHASLSLNHGGTIMWHFLLQPSLMAVSAWLIVPASLHMPATICRAKPTWAISVVAAPIITFVLFCHVLIYPLAQRSLIAGSPFHRFWCLRALYQRHSPSDIAAVYTAIQNANWTTELPWDGMGDYRAQCVEFLQAHDPRHAAEFLSQQLRAHPSYLLAEAAAPLLVEQKRYETAPLLMRYSWTWLSAGQSNDPPLCAGALADMGVPAAALPILVQCDPTVDPTTRSRLTQLLGTDAGPELDAWNKLYGAVIKHRPTPLTPQLTAEINRTIHMALAYADALRSRAWGAQRLAARRMVRIGETEATDTQLANDPDLNYRLHLYLPDALADFTVPSPDQDVPTVDEFQREIERYKSRVEALLTQYHIIQPATTPATVPAR